VSAELTCPSCTTRLRPRNPIPAGKSVCCPKCQTTFAVPRAKPRPSPRLNECIEVVEVDEEDQDLKDDDRQPRRRQARSGARPRRSELRSIAVLQKVVLIGLLVLIIGAIAQLLVADTLRMVIGIVLFPVALAYLVFVFMLAIRLYGPGVGAMLGILTLIPLIGLIAILVISGKATSTLQRGGYRVGLLGARLSEFD